MPIISIIIPFFNNRRITSCLQTLLRQSYKNREIIVVNNNSSSRYLELLKEYPILFFHEKLQGSYPARNKGIENARGQYVAFIDADCLAKDDWLEELYKAIKENDADMVLGHVDKIISPKKKNPELVDKNIYHDHKTLFSRGIGTTANLMVSRKVLREIRGFSYDYFSGEDTEFIKKAVNTGFKYVYAPDAVVYHPCRKSTFSLMAKGFRTGISDGNRKAASIKTRKEKIEFLSKKCLALFDPLRKDITDKCRDFSLGYAASYYLHFFAHGWGRLIGTTTFSRTEFFRKLTRYT